MMNILKGTFKLFIMILTMIILMLMMMIRSNLMCNLQEKQLKKIRAKQKRLQAILGGDDSLRVEAELLAEDDGEEGELAHSPVRRLTHVSLSLEFLIRCTPEII